MRRLWDTRTNKRHFKFVIDLADCRQRKPWFSHSGWVWCGLAAHWARSSRTRTESRDCPATRATASIRWLHSDSFADTPQPATWAPSRPAADCSGAPTSGHRVRANSNPTTDAGKGRPICEHIRATTSSERQYAAWRASEADL